MQAGEVLHLLSCNRLTICINITEIVNSPTLLQDTFPSAPYSKVIYCTVAQVMIDLAEAHTWLHCQGSFNSGVRQPP